MPLLLLTKLICELLVQIKIELLDVHLFFLLFYNLNILQIFLLQFFVRCSYILKLRLELFVLGYLLLEVLFK